MIDFFKEKEWYCYFNCTSQNVDCSLVFILQIPLDNFKPIEIGQFLKSPRHSNLFSKLLLATVNSGGAGIENPNVFRPVWEPQTTLLSKSVISGYDK